MMQIPIYILVCETVSIQVKQTIKDNFQAQLKSSCSVSVVELANICPSINKLLSGFSLNASIFIGTFSITDGAFKQ